MYHRQLIRGREAKVVGTLLPARLCQVLRVVVEAAAGVARRPRSFPRLVGCLLQHFFLAHLIPPFFLLPLLSSLLTLRSPCGLPGLRRRFEGQHAEKVLCCGVRCQILSLS